MAAYEGGLGGRSPPTAPPGKPKGCPPWKKYFILSNHKCPEFEIIQNPGGGLTIFVALRAPLPEKPLPMKIFLSRHDFT